MDIEPRCRGLAVGLGGDPLGGRLAGPVAPGRPARPVGAPGAGLGVEQITPRWVQTKINVTYVTTN